MRHQLVAVTVTVSFVAASCSGHEDTAPTTASETGVSAASTGSSGTASSATDRITAIGGGDGATRPLTGWD
jgi:hypothetical protein